MTVSENAIAAGAKAPADRLGKTPRRTTIGIYLDETVAEAYEQAVADLDARLQQLSTEQPRRHALALAKARDEGRSEEAAILEVDAAIREEVAPLEEQVAKSLAALDDGTLWLTFRSIGRKQFRALVEAHPASAMDQADWDAAGQQGKAPYAPESFARDLVQAASYGRTLSRADVLEMAEGEAWNDEEWGAVFQTALAAQTAARTVQHRQKPS